MYLFLQISIIFAFPTILMTIYGFSIILYYSQKSHEQVNDYAQSIYEQQISNSKILNNAIQFQLSQQVQRKSWSVQLMNQFSLKVIEGEAIMNKNYKSMFLNTERTYANKDEPSATYLFKKNKFGVVQVRTWHQYEYLYVNQFDQIGQEHLKNSTYSDLLWRLFEYDNILSSNSSRYLKFNSIYHVFEHNSMGYLSATNTTFKNFKDPDGCPTGPNHFNGKCRYWYTLTVKQDSMILYPPDLFFSDQGNPFLASVLCQKLLRHNKTLHWVKCTSLNLQKMQSFFANMGNFSTYTMVIDPRNYSVIYHSTVPQQRAIANTLGSVELDNLQDQSQAQLFRDQIQKNYGNWVISEIESVQADEILLPNYQKTFTYYRNGSEALAICNPVIIIDKIQQKNKRLLSDKLDGELLSENEYQIANNLNNISQEKYINKNLINITNHNKNIPNRNQKDKKDYNEKNINEIEDKQNQQKRVIQQNNKKYRLEASFLLIDVLSQNDLKKFSIQMLNDTDYYSQISYITIFSILTVLTLFILYQSICITHMIQFPIWHLTNFLKKINDSGDLNKFNTVNQAFSINVESFFYSEDMKILFISFKNMFQMLTFTNQSYFNSELSATLLNYNKQIIHFEKFKNYRALGVCHNNIANILFYLERYIEALQHYESSIVYSKLELGLYSKDFIRDEDKPDDVRMFQSKQASEITNNQFRKQSDHQRIPSIFNRKSSTQAQTIPKSNQISNLNGQMNHDQFEKEAKLQQSNYFLNQSIGLHQNLAFQNMQASVINKLDNLNNISFLVSSAQQLQNNLEGVKQANILKQKKKSLNQIPHNQNLINNDQNQLQQAQNKEQLQNNNTNYNNNDSHFQSNFNLVQNNEKNNKSEEKGSLSSEEEELQIVGYLIQQTREYHQLIFNLYHRKMNYLKCFINFLNSKQSCFSQFLWEEAEVLANELISLAKYFPKKNGRNTIVYSYLSLIQTKQQKWKEAEESCLIAKEYVMKAYEYENHHQEIQNNEHVNRGDELYTQIYQELSEDNLFNDQDLYNFFSELPSQTYPSKQILDKSLCVNKAISLIQNNSNKNQYQVQNNQTIQKHNAKKNSLKDTNNLQSINENRDIIQKQYFQNNQQSEVAFTDHKKRNSQVNVSNKFLPHQSISIKQTEDKMHLNERKLSTKINQRGQADALNSQHNSHNTSSCNNAKLISFLINQRIIQYKNQKQLLQFLGSNQTNSQRQEINSLNQNFYTDNHQNNINNSIYQSVNLQGHNNIENQRPYQLVSVKQQNNLIFNPYNTQVSPLQAKNYTSPQLNNNIVALKEKEQQTVNQYFKSVNEVIQEEDQLHQDLQHTESQMSQELYQIKMMKQKQKNQQIQLPFKADFQKPEKKVNQSFNQNDDSVENSLAHSNHEIYKELNQMLSNQQLFSAKKLNEDASYAYEPYSVKLSNDQVIKDNQQQNNQIQNELQNNLIWNEQQNMHVSNIQYINQNNQTQQNQLQKTKKSYILNRTYQNSNHNFNNNSAMQNISKVKNQHNSKNLQNYEYPACVLHGIQINFNVAILLNQHRLLEAANKITDYIEQSLQYLPHYNFRILYQLQLIFQRFRISSFQLNELLKVYKKQIYQRVGIIATCALEKNKKNSYYFCKDLMKDILKHEEDTFGLLSYQDQLFNLKISNISYITLNKNIDMLKKTLRQIFFSIGQETQEIKFQSQQQLIKPRNNFIEKVSPFSAAIKKNTKSKNKSQSNATNINEKSNSHNQEFDDLTNQQIQLSNDTSFLSLDQSFSKKSNHQWQTLQNQNNNNNNNNNHHDSANLSANNSPNMTLFNTQPQQIQNKSQRSNTVGNIKKASTQFQNHRSSLKQENKMQMGALCSRQNQQQILHDFAPLFVNADESRKNTTQASKRSIETQLFEKSLNPQEIFHIGIRKALTHFVPHQQFQNILNQQFYQTKNKNEKKNQITESKQIDNSYFSLQEKEKQSSSFQKVFQEATNIQIKEKNYKKYLIFLTDQYNVPKNNLYFQLCELLYQLDIQLLILQFNKDESIDEHSKSTEEFVENKCVIQYFYSQKKLLQYLYNQRSDYQSNLLPLAVEHFQTNFLFVFIF
ncbi:hypothetical protein ABPG74_020456 [Tetrahymena malaccensis]